MDPRVKPEDPCTSSLLVDFMPNSDGAFKGDHTDVELYTEAFAQTCTRVK